MPNVKENLWERAPKSLEQAHELYRSPNTWRFIGPKDNPKFQAIEAAYREILANPHQYEVLMQGHDLLIPKFKTFFAERFGLSKDSPEVNRHVELFRRLCSVFLWQFVTPPSVMPHQVYNTNLPITLDLSDIEHYKVRVKVGFRYRLIDPEQTVAYWLPGEGRGEFEFRFSVEGEDEPMLTSPTGKVLSNHLLQCLDDAERAPSIVIDERVLQLADLEEYYRYSTRSHDEEVLRAFKVAYLDSNMTVATLQRRWPAELEYAPRSEVAFRDINKYKGMEEVKEQVLERLERVRQRVGRLNPSLNWNKVKSLIRRAKKQDDLRRSLLAYAEEVGQRAKKPLIDRALVHYIGGIFAYPDGMHPDHWRHTLEAVEYDERGHFFVRQLLRPFGALPADLQQLEEFERDYQEVCDNNPHPRVVESLELAYKNNCAQAFLKEVEEVTHYRPSPIVSPWQNQPPSEKSKGQTTQDNPVVKAMAQEKQTVAREASSRRSNKEVLKDHIEALHQQHNRLWGAAHRAVPFWCALKKAQRGSFYSSAFAMAQLNAVEQTESKVENRGEMNEGWRYNPVGSHPASSEVKVEPAFSGLKGGQRQPLYNAQLGPLECKGEKVESARSAYRAEQHTYDALEFARDAYRKAHKRKNRRSYLVTNEELNGRTVQSLLKGDLEVDAFNAVLLAAQTGKRYRKDSFKTFYLSCLCEKLEGNDDLQSPAWQEKIKHYTGHKNFEGQFRQWLQFACRGLDMRERLVEQVFVPSNGKKSKKQSGPAAPPSLEQRLTDLIDRETTYLLKVFGKGRLYDHRHPKVIRARERLSFLIKQGKAFCQKRNDREKAKIYRDAVQGLSRGNSDLAIMTVSCFCSSQKRAPAYTIPAMQKVVEWEAPAPA